MAQDKSRVAVFIDPQNMFMPIEGMPLPVAGADQDMIRAAEYLITSPCRYDAIFVTLDTHPADHIAHPVRWVNEQGKNPDPFTLITAADYEAGSYRAADPEDEAVQAWYLPQLEATGRVHTIWPPHGEKYTKQHEVYAVLKFALGIWERKTGTQVQYVQKGMHRDTEQFGVFAADVPIEGAPETALNVALVDEINSYDAIDFFGEASSHCVLDSVKQFMLNVDISHWRKITVFRDCMSPVAAVVDPESGETIVDFPAQAEAWFEELRMQDVNVAKVADLLSPKPLN